VTAKASLGLSGLAVVLSALALVFSMRGHHHASACGPREGVVACVGNDAPPSKYGACSPVVRESGVMLWQCRKG